MSPSRGCAFFEVRITPNLPKCFFFYFRVAWVPTHCTRGLAWCWHAFETSQCYPQRQNFTGSPSIALILFGTRNPLIEVYSLLRKQARLFFFSLLPACLGCEFHLTVKANFKYVGRRTKLINEINSLYLAPTYEVIQPVFCSSVKL